MRFSSWVQHAGLDCRKDVRRFKISSSKSGISYLAVIVEKDPVGKAMVKVASSKGGDVVLGGCPV
jgi:hypothetical protein